VIDAITAFLIILANLLIFALGFAMGRHWGQP
jgi:hypothetical protein